jgi:hypothetical protein
MFVELFAIVRAGLPMITDVLFRLARSPLWAAWEQVVAESSGTGGATFPETQPVPFCGPGGSINLDQPLECFDDLAGLLRQRGHHASRPDRLRRESLAKINGSTTTGTQSEVKSSFMDGVGAVHRLAGVSSRPLALRQPKMTSL